MIGPMSLGTGIIGGAAFPQVVGVLESSSNSFTTSHSIPFPGGTTLAGELLLLMSATNSALASLSGWTVLSNARMFTAYKTASGSEGASIPISLSNNRVIASVVYRIRRWHGVPSFQTVDGSGANPDPPSLTASWGIKKTLWIAGACALRVTGSPQPQITGFPTGFSGGVEDQAYPGSGSSVAIGAATRNDDTTATIDPDAFTAGTGTVGNQAVTIAIR